MTNTPESRTTVSSMAFRIDDVLLAFADAPKHDLSAKEGVTPLLKAIRH
jgi:hypothetical protein